MSEKLLENVGKFEYFRKITFYLDHSFQKGLDPHLRISFTPSKGTYLTREIAWENI